MTTARSTRIGDWLTRNGFHVTLHDANGVVLDCRPAVMIAEADRLMAMVTQAGMRRAIIQAIYDPACGLAAIELVGVHDGMMRREDA